MSGSTFGQRLAPNNGARTRSQPPPPQPQSNPDPVLPQVVENTMAAGIGGGMSDQLRALQMQLQLATQQNDLTALRLMEQSRQQHEVNLSLQADAAFGAAQERALHAFEKGIIDSFEIDVRNTSSRD